MAARGAVAKKPRWGGGMGLMWVILKEPLNHSGPQFPQLDSSLSRHHGFYLFSGSRVKGKCEPQVTFREGHPGLRVNEDSRTRDITC